METPFTPLEFARRSRKLYPEREAVVDGDLRLSYEQFRSIVVAAGGAPAVKTRTPRRVRWTANATDAHRLRCWHH